MSSAKIENPNLTKVFIMDYKFLIGALVLGIIEIFNLALHIANYSLANVVGANYFLVDILGLPPYELINNLSVSDLLNTLLGMGAVITPIVGWHWFLDHQEEIFEDSSQFFQKGLNRIVGLMIAITYGFVVMSEFSVLMLRILETTTPGPIANIGEEQTGLLPMLIMAVTIILINLGLGFAVASVIRSRNMEGEF